MDLGNEGVLCIPQRSNITRTSSSDCLVSYPGHSLERSYFSADMQLVYSKALANWAKSITFESSEGWVVCFYGISTIAGYLMPNPVFTYFLNIGFGNLFCKYTPPPKKKTKHTQNKKQRNNEKAKTKTKYLFIPSRNPSLFYDQLKSADTTIPTHPHGTYASTHPYRYTQAPIWIYMPLCIHSYLHTRIIPPEYVHQITELIVLHYNI